MTDRPTHVPAPIFPDEVTLRDVAPGNPHQHKPIQTRGGDTVIALEWSDTTSHLIVATDDGRTVELPPGTAGTTNVNTHAAITALRTAVAVQADQIRDLRCELEEADGRHTHRLVKVREYLIDRHLDGAIDLRELNAFLNYFDLPMHLTRMRVFYTVTGHYDVEDTENGLDADIIRRDAEDNILPDLDTITDLVPDSSEYTVEATAEPTPHE